MREYTITHTASGWAYTHNVVAESAEAASAAFMASFPPEHRGIIRIVDVRLAPNPHGWNHV